ncbi:MAG: sulfotransferase [Burkholderiales bacterium]|nr:sulfotransferase [Burkholderiales bacterium]
MRNAVVSRAPWNAALHIAQVLGYTGARVDAETLLARAARRTGLDDFGDPEFVVPLELMLGDFRRHTPADITGRQVFAAMINAALENRLHVREHLRVHPDIAAVPIVAPIFIVGLPRTGTTLLQQLLACVPGMRTLLGWEALMPAVLPALASPRALALHRSRVERQMRFAFRLSPLLTASHTFGVEEVEECNTLLLASMRALRTGLHACPNYEDFLYETGLRGSYDYHKPHLQVLSYRAPPATWVLKAPAHMAALPELLKVYPDARVVFTHRDPVESVPSTAGLVDCMNALLSPVRDREAIGARVLAMLRRMQGAARVARERWPASATQYIDIDYAELVRAPLAAVRSILLHFGIPEPEGTGTAVLGHLRRQRRTRAPPVRYTCAQFGIHADAAASVLQDLAAPDAVPGEGGTRPATPSRELIAGQSGDDEQ